MKRSWLVVLHASQQELCRAREIGMRLEPGEYGTSWSFKGTSDQRLIVSFCREDTHPHGLVSPAGAGATRGRRAGAGSTDISTQENESLSEAGTSVGD